MSYSTGSDTIEQMYADIVQDLVPSRIGGFNW